MENSPKTKRRRDGRTGYPGIPLSAVRPPGEKPDIEVSGRVRFCRRHQENAGLARVSALREPDIWMSGSVRVDAVAGADIHDTLENQLILRREPFLLSC